MQVFEIEVDSYKTVGSKAGSMNFMEGEITLEAKMRDGSQPIQRLFGKLLYASSYAFTQG